VIGRSGKHHDAANPDGYGGSRENITLSRRPAAVGNQARGRPSRVKPARSATRWEATFSGAVCRFSRLMPQCAEGPSEMLVAVGQAAIRYDIPADPTGTIERGSFPATLFGASGAITVTLRDERVADEGRDPILDVIHRTEPVPPTSARFR
jgi:hypothetical protein